MHVTISKDREWKQDFLHGIQEYPFLIVKLFYKSEQKLRYRTHSTHLKELKAALVNKKIKHLFQFLDSFHSILIQIPNRLRLVKIGQAIIPREQWMCAHKCSWDSLDQRKPQRLVFIFFGDGGRDPATTFPYHWGVMAIGKGPLQRPRNKCKSNIKMDSKYTGYKDRAKGGIL